MGKVSDELGHARQLEQVDKSSKRVLGIDMDEEARNLAIEARDESHRAKAMVLQHEAVCEERWKRQGETSLRLETSLTALTTTVNTQLASLQRGIDERVGKIPATIIAAMAGVIGFLADRAFPLH